MKYTPIYNKKLSVFFYDYTVQLIRPQLNKLFLSFGLIIAHKKTNKHTSRYRSL